MKHLIVLSLALILSADLFAQEIETGTKTKNWKLGVLGGAAFSDVAGPSALVEFKTNYLLENLFSKISVGYAYVTSDELIHRRGYEDKSYSVHYPDGHYDFYKSYETYDYDITQSKYNNVPVTIGFEYYFPQNGFAPYALCEFGLNLHYVDVRERKNYTTALYNSLEEVPQRYKEFGSEHRTSLRFTLGAGTNIDLFPGLSLDVRGFYQLSDVIGNNAQFLAGLVF